MIALEFVIKPILVGVCGERHLAMNDDAPRIGREYLYAFSAFGIRAGE